MKDFNLSNLNTSFDSIMPYLKSYLDCQEESCRQNTYKT